jgi:hypothetical protein
VWAGFGYNDFNREPFARAALARRRAARAHDNMVIEASYWGQWATGSRLAELDPSAAVWATGNVRNNALANAECHVRTVLHRQLRSHPDFDPVLYQQMSTTWSIHQHYHREEPAAAPFPAHERHEQHTIRRQARHRCMELNFNRRFARGFQLSTSYTG